MTDRYAESDTWPNPPTSTEPARPATESDADGSRVVGEGSDAQKAREARYEAAVFEPSDRRGILAAVMAVADAELAEARAENERLRGEAGTLGSVNASLRAEIERLKEAWQDEYGRARSAEAEVEREAESHARLAIRHREAESALTEAREQLSRLREAVEGLANDPDDSPQCSCGAPDAYSLNPAEMIVHSVGDCYIAPAPSGSDLTKGGEGHGPFAYDGKGRAQCMSCGEYTDDDTKGGE